VQQFLAIKNMVVVPHPPYLPDLSPCDFFLFLRTKSQLKGCHFQAVSENQEQLLTVISKISVTAVLPAVAEMLDPLHKHGRGLL
jgi:hypothetical protein